MHSELPQDDTDQQQGKDLDLGYVVSDLHIFARWSSIENYMASIRTAAGSADFFVFNGDIFDFKWSTLESSETTSEKAADWLLRFCRDFPNCHFFYVMGNHDCHTTFGKALKTLADEVSNFSWSDAYFRIGTALFMHGDLVLSRKGHSPFAREAFRDFKPRHTALGQSYHAVISMGAHSLNALLFTKKKCAKQLLKVLMQQNRPEMQGVADIYIGHTHASFSDFEYGGFTFHNSGSAVHDLHYNMMQIGSRKNS